MEFVVVIPARLASSRLPEKPLLNIYGKSLIQRTYEQCIKAVNEKLVYVATDNIKIYDHCEKLGIKVVMTSEKCLTGTDRIAEFAGIIKADYYINVQGDEPLIDPKDIQKIINSLSQHAGEILNGYTRIEDETSYYSKMIPKVVVDIDKILLYMSRAPIPGNKGGEFIKAWRQVCVYAFPYNSLKTFNECKKKTPLEQIEDIEILRFVELGFKVRMIELSNDSISVDTPEDVIKVKRKLDLEL